MHDGFFLHTVTEDEVQENFPTDMSADEYGKEVMRSVMMVITVVCITSAICPLTYF